MPPVNTLDPPRKLKRSIEDRVVAGVCGGLGDYFDVDPAWIRISFVVATSLFGIGVIAYAVLWVTLPDEGEEGEGEEAALVATNPRAVAGVALVSLGLLLVLSKVVAWLGVHLLVAVIALGLGVFLLVYRRP